MAWHMREQDKHFLWSLYAAVAVIFVWKGLWDAIYEIPYVGDPFVFLFIGFSILTFSGLIFKEFDPLGGIGKAVHSVVMEVKKHPETDSFVLHYYDKAQKKPVAVPLRYVQKVERGAVVLRHPSKNQELFIPAHRITEITYKGERYWRL